MDIFGVGGHLSAYHRNCCRPGISSRSSGFFEWETVFQIHMLGAEDSVISRMSTSTPTPGVAIEGGVAHRHPCPVQAAARPSPPVLPQARPGPPHGSQRLLCTGIGREWAQVCLGDLAQALFCSENSCLPWFSSPPRCERRPPLLPPLSLCDEAGCPRVPPQSCSMGCVRGAGEAGRRALSLDWTWAMRPWRACLRVDVPLPSREQAGAGLRGAWGGEKKNEPWCWWGREGTGGCSVGCFSGSKTAILMPPLGRLPRAEQEQLPCPCPWAPRASNPATFQKAQVGGRAAGPRAPRFCPPRAL